VTPDKPLPLLGLRILTFEQFGAGPFATMNLADLGAAILDPVMATRSSAEWVALLAGKVPVAPVLTLAEALDNPYLRDRGGELSIDHPLRHDLATVASAIRSDGARLTARPGPGYGADTASVLAEGGYSADEITQLRALGAV